jgi:tRNA1(Val) A37 N6-methylase TrmN6
MTDVVAGPLTVDAFLGGRVEAVQADDGRHRSGLEAVMLAAAIEANFEGTVVDLGAGAGVAGFCVAARCPGASVLLVERDRDAIACARAALTRPANRTFAARVGIVEVDIEAPETDRASAGLRRAGADAVIVNPPFHREGAGTASPVPERAIAHVLPENGLDPWFRTAASALKPEGVLVAIFHASGLGELLKAIDRRFGAVRVLPIHSRAGVPAGRVMVRAVKGSRAPFSLLPGIALHGEGDGAYLPAVEAILRGAAALADACPAWRA